MYVVAHRGASGSAPEHTFPAYDLALEAGADALELDVHLTRDRVPVVLHDATLDRVAGQPDFVADVSLEELKRLDAGAWFGARWRGLRIPTLAEVFRRYGTATRYYVEIKDPELYPGIERKVSGLIRTHGLTARATVMSFSGAGLRRVRRAGLGLPLIHLYPEGARPHVAVDASCAHGIGLWRGDVDEATFEAARAAGIETLVYTVDSFVEVRALSALGVDHLVTDFPSRLTARRSVTTAGALR